MKKRIAQIALIILALSIVSCGDSSTTGPSDPEWDFPSTVSSIITTAAWPNYFAALPDESKLFLSNSEAGIVSVIDTNTENIIATINVSELSFPMGITTAFSGSNIYVSGYSFIAVINAQSYELEEVLELNFDSRDIAAAANGYIYISSNTPYIYVMDSYSNTIVDSVYVGQVSMAMIASPDGSNIYAGVSPNEIAVIDTYSNTVIHNISLQESSYPLYEMAVSTDGRLYCACSESNNVAVIDMNTNSLITTIPLGKTADGIALTADGKFVFAAANNANAVIVISTEDYSIERVMPISAGPAGIYITSDNKAYIACNNSDQIYVLE